MPQYPNEAQAIENLQRYLRQLSYSDASITPPPIDGIWERDTAQALRDFQRTRGIPETGIVLDHFRSVFREHQSEVQAAFECPSLFVQSIDSGTEYLLHAFFRDLFGIIGVWSHRSHSSGIETRVIVSRSLVIH